jgi:hypothetical protein
MPVVGTSRRGRLIRTDDGHGGAEMWAAADTDEPTTPATAPVGSTSTTPPPGSPIHRRTPAQGTNSW